MVIQGISMEQIMVVNLLNTCLQTTNWSCLIFCSSAGVWIMLLQDIGSQHMSMVRVAETTSEIIISKPESTDLFDGDPQASRQRSVCFDGKH